MEKTRPDNDYDFSIGGQFFDIDPALEPYVASDGWVIGFTLPDGSIARLAAALEVERPDGTVEYLTTEDDFEKRGFRMLDYNRLGFMKR